VTPATMFLSLLLSQSPATEAPPQVALFPLALQDLSPAGRSAATRAIWDAFEELGAVALQPPAETWRKLQPIEAQGFACAGEPACLAEAGRELGVAQVAHVEVAAREGFYFAQLRLVDVAAATELRKVQAQISRDPDTSPAELRGLVIRLVAPERYVGAIRVLAPSDAQVVIDDQNQGNAPLAGPIEPLAVGEHAVKIVLVDGEAVERMVEVRFGQLATVDLREAPSGLGSVSHQPLPQRSAASSTAWVEPGAEFPDTRSAWPLWTSGLLSLGAVATAATAAVTWGLAVNANQRALDWAIEEHAGRPPEDAAGIDESYFQPLAESETLQTLSSVLGIGAGLSATAALGVLGYAIAEGALLTGDDQESATTR